MFDISHENIVRELEAAERRREKHTKHIKSMVEQYARVSTADDGQAINPSGHVFEYLSFMVPKIIYDKPRVSVTSRRALSQGDLETIKLNLLDQVMSGQMELEEAVEMADRAMAPMGYAKAIRYGLNRWIVDSDYKNTLVRACYDALIGPWGILVSSIETMPGEDPDDPEAKRWPTSARVSPNRFLIDSQCLHESEAQWEAHWEAVDKDDFEAEAEEYDKHLGKYRMDVIRALDPKPANEDRKELVNRNEIRLHQIWVRNYREDDWPSPSDGYNGAFLTIAHYGSDRTGNYSEFLRDPMPAFCPPWGPYSKFGAYVVPDSEFTTSPLIAQSTQLNELNSHARAVSKGATQYKRVVFVSSRNPRIAELLTSSPHDFIVPVSDPSFDVNDIKSVEIAGVTRQQMEVLQIMQGRLDSVSGMDSPERGKVEGQGTATEHAIADEATKTRTGHMQRTGADFVAKDLRTKAWFMTYEDRVSFPLGPEAASDLKMIEPTFMGGDDGLDFFDLGLEIEPYSMERTNESLMRRQAFEAFQLILNAAPIMIQLPQVDWKNMLDRIGQTMNDPTLSDVINFEDLKKMAGAAQGQPGQPGQVDGSGGFSDSPRPAAAQARMIGNESGVGVR